MFQICIDKMSKTNFIDNVNCFRDFIHLDDVVDSLDILISKNYEKIINISSGRKINLIEVCKILNSNYFHKKINTVKEEGKIYLETIIIKIFR